MKQLSKKNRIASTAVNLELVIKRESQMRKLWQQKWGKIYFPEGNLSTSTRISRLKQRTKKTDEAEGNVYICRPVETLGSRHGKRRNKELRPAFPY